MLKVWTTSPTLKTSTFLNTAVHVGHKLHHLLSRIESKSREMLHGQTSTLVHRFWSAASRRMMAVTAVMLTTLTNGYTRTTSLMRLVLFTRHADGTTARAAVPCRCAEIASQGRHAMSPKNTTHMASMNMVTSMARWKWWMSSSKTDPSFAVLQFLNH